MVLSLGFEGFEVPTSFGLQTIETALWVQVLPLKAYGQTLVIYTGEYMREKYITWLQLGFSLPRGFRS